MTAPGSGVVESSSLDFFLGFASELPFDLALSFTGQEFGFPAKCAVPSNTKELWAPSVTTLVTIVLPEQVPLGLDTVMLEIEPGVVWTFGLGIVAPFLLEDVQISGRDQET